MFSHKMTILAPKQSIMALKIREVAKSKGISMGEIAEKMGITQITLSQSLNGNPTLSRLQEVADVIGVDVSELFEYPNRVKDIHGCIFVEGKPIVINNKDELIDLAKKI